MVLMMAYSHAVNIFPPLAACDELSRVGGIHPTASPERLAMAGVAGGDHSFSATLAIWTSTSRHNRLYFPQIIYKFV